MHAEIRVFDGVYDFDGRVWQVVDLSVMHKGTLLDAGGFGF